MFGLAGFAAAVFLDERQVGMAMFLVGFFGGAASAVFIALTSAHRDLGTLGTSIKIASSGFGLIVLGQLVGLLLDQNGLIGDIFFFLGITVMMAGIVVAALRMARS